MPSVLLFLAIVLMTLSFMLRQASVVAKSLGFPQDARALVSMSHFAAISGFMLFITAYPKMMPVIAPYSTALLY